MDYGKIALQKHAEWKGKIEITARAAVDSAEALSVAYTPGVAAPCLEIQKNPEKSYELTRRWNTVAVITDGTAVLGLGDIGPEAGMPVMEGKCGRDRADGQPSGGIFRRHQPGGYSSSQMLRDREETQGML